MPFQKQHFRAMCNSGLAGKRPVFEVVSKTFFPVQGFETPAGVS